MSLGVAASTQVVWITRITGWTEALTLLTNGTWSALQLGAFAHATSVRAGKVTWTGRDGTTGASRWVVTSSNFHECARSEWVAQKSLFATTVVTANRVDANGVTATCISVALVDIFNLNKF